MLVHSYIYYHLDQSIISDDRWQELANDLRDLQDNFETKNINFYDDEFSGWDGATGCHLPKDSWVVSKSNKLLKEYNKGVRYGSEK